MLRGHKSSHRLVQQFGGFRRTMIPRTFMPEDRIGIVVDTVIECPLVRIASFGRRRMQQRQAQRIVGRFVPAVLAVVQDRHATRSVRRRQVGPFVSRHLIRQLRIVAAFKEAQTQIVCRLFIGHRTREFRLEQDVAARPVNPIADVDTIVHAAVGQ